jgi:hypothetical protein
MRTKNPNNGYNILIVLRGKKNKEAETQMEFLKNLEANIY